MVALIITIIVLLILVGVTISSISGGGIIGHANQAKSNAEKADEIESIQTAIIEAAKRSRYGEVTEQGLKAELEKKFGEGKVSIEPDEESGYIIRLIEKDSYYKVDGTENIVYLGKTSDAKTLTVNCVNSKNTILDTKEFYFFTQNYSKTLPQIECQDGTIYVPAEKTITGTIEEDETIQANYYLLCNDDKTLLFTGLDSSGNTTTTESEIKSYMVGDGTTTGGNGMKEEYRTIQSIVVIPDTYKGENVTSIGQWSFRNLGNIVDVTIGDNVTRLGTQCFFACTGVKNLVIGKNASSFGNYSTDFANLENATIRFFSFPSNFTLKVKNLLKLDGNEDVFQVVDNILYSADGTTLIYNASNKDGKFVIPTSIMEGTEVTTLSTSSFVGSSSLTEVVIPDTITSIGSVAFISLKITSVTIGSNVRSIGNRSFECGGLTTVIINSPTVANGLTANNSMGSLINKATTVYIKDSITAIGSYVTNNFTVVESDKEGYVKYEKNT